MTAPLSHYFIYTGHNSYLTGNQLNSDCSVVPIINALKRGVRVVELDMWPSDDAKDGVHVYHGWYVNYVPTLIFLFYFFMVCELCNWLLGNSFCIFDVHYQWRFNLTQLYPISIFMGNTLSSLSQLSAGSLLKQSWWLKVIVRGILALGEP